MKLRNITFIFFALMFSQLCGVLTPFAFAASSPWSQTNWIGGSGQASWSDNTKFLSSSSVDTSVANQVSLSATNNWYNNAWGYRKKITIDGTKVTGTLTNYPLLVNLALDASMSTHAQTDADDFVFTSNNGITKLDHQIEKYTNGTGSLQAWVRIPTLPSGQDTDIYVYYGNAGANNQQNAVGVWDDNYIAVYHLNETSGQHLDPASNLNSVAVAVTAQGTAVGKIDGADDFNGTSGNSVQVSDNSLLEPDTLTVESWINPDTLASTLGRDEVFVVKSHGSTPWKSYNLYLSSPFNNIGFNWVNSSDGEVQRFSDNSAPTGSWTYVGAVKSGTTQSVYLNGVDNSGYSSGAATGTIKNSDGPLYLGAAGAFSFDGKMDEVRLSNIARSATYFSTTYANLNAPGSFISLGTEETTTSITGILNSSIIDTGNASDWGVVTFTATTPTNTTAVVKVRTGNSPTLSDASAFSLCSGVTSTTDISSNACVTDKQRYIQYQLTLTTSDVLATASFTQFSQAFAPSPAPPSTDFVQRIGSNLYLNGSVFKFSGTNIYWLALDENVGGVDYPTNFRIDNAMATAKEMGANVVRTYLTVGCSKCIETSLGTFNDSGFQMLDYALKSASDNGIKLAINLVDNWHYFHGGKHTFTDWRSVSEDSFYTDSNVISDFETYVSYVLNHVNSVTGIAYKNDPTIMSWETGNELSISAGSWPSAWTNTISSYIKSIDANHLVSDGHISDSGGSVSLDQTSLTYSAVDMYAIHDYPPDNGQLANDSSLVSSYNKVFWVGEYDWTELNGGSSLSSFLNSIESNSAISGDTFWSLFGHLDTYGYEQHVDGYTLHYPGDSASMRTQAQAIRNHAYLMRGVSVPPHIVTTSPLLNSVTASSSGNSLNWRGVVGADLYTIERADENNTWSTLITGKTDNDLPYLDATATFGKKYAYRAVGVNLDNVRGEASNAVYSNGSFTIPTPSLPETVSSSPSAPMCNAQSISGIPALFQANSNGNKITLYFTTVGAASGYHVSYGKNKEADQYAEVFSYEGPFWVMSRQINLLSPNSTYYFKVRAANGCTAGKWSNIVKVKTGRISATNQNINTMATPQNDACDYTVQKGDSLWGIASLKLGSGTKYSSIMNLNGLSSSLLHIGQRLKIN